MDLKLLGRNIRQLRTQKGLTVDSLAQKAGLSKALLSKIERGLTAPSLASLRKTAQALGTPIVAFFQGDSFTDDLVVRKAHRKTLHVPDVNITYELLTPDLQNRKMEFLLTEIEPNTNDDLPHTHEGEECGLVLQGKLNVQIDGRSVVLNTGDSITFPAFLPHCITNPRKSRSVSVWAIVPPLY